MAVVMFMVDAMQYFETIPKEKIQEIAVEIAINGTQGFNPAKNDYSIPSIPAKVFSGYHILAYFYVSWALAMPGKLAELQLPFDREFELAKKMKQEKK